LQIVTSPTLDPAEILEKLNAKFSCNLELALAQQPTRLIDLEIRTRVLGEFGPLLRETECKTLTQDQLASLPEEVFADVVTSLYLGAIGLVKPAEMSLRRAVELGLALVYLWDLPHAFWGWKECDMDLSFSLMVEHLDSPSYRSFLASTIGLSVNIPLFNSRQLREIYRWASNTTHGKISTHKVLIGDGFSHVPAEWSDCLKLLNSAVAEVLNLWFNRYPNVAKKAREIVPAYNRICNS
jgi:hypothetical protein